MIGPFDVQNLRVEFGSMEVRDDGSDDLVKEILSRSKSGEQLSTKALNIDVQDHLGNTALHYATEQCLQGGCTPMARNILLAGARADITNKKHQTAASLLLNLPQCQFEALFSYMSQNQQNELKVTAHAEGRRIISEDGRVSVRYQDDEISSYFENDATGSQNGKQPCTLVNILQLGEESFMLLNPKRSPQLLAKLSPEFSDDGGLGITEKPQSIVKLFDVKNNRRKNFDLTSCLTWANTIPLPGCNEVLCYSCSPLTSDPEVPVFGTVNNYWCQTKLLETLDDKLKSLFTGEMHEKSLEPPMQFQFCDRNNRKFLTLSAGLSGVVHRYTFLIPQGEDQFIENGHFGLCHLRTIDSTTVKAGNFVEPTYFPILTEFILRTFTVDKRYGRSPCNRQPDLRLIEADW